MAVRIRTVLSTLPSYAPGRTVPGAIKLASNELSFPTLPAVSEAIAAAVGADTDTAGINRYPDNGAAALVELLAEQLDAPAAAVLTGNGSVALCQQLVQAVAGDGDEVVFGWRSFEAYPIVTQITGARPVLVPNTADHRLDLAALAAAVTDATRLMFVCTPNNPTGTALTHTEVVELLDGVPDDVLVVIDQAYREFDRSSDPVDGVKLALSRPNVVALGTLSKAYGLAGVRVGYAVSTPETISALRKVAIPFALSSIGQVAAIAALKARDELVPRWEQVVSERSRVVAALTADGYEIPPTEANFVWLPLREDAKAFAEHCETHKVVVRAFPDAAGGVRVTIGSPEENDAFLAAAAAWTGRRTSD